MIIKVPIYLEVEGKFTPSQGQEIVQILRSEIKAWITKSAGGYFTFSYDGSRKRCIILSDTQVTKRLTKGTNEMLGSPEIPKKG